MATLELNEEAISLLKECIEKRIDILVESNVTCCRLLTANNPMSNHRKVKEAYTNNSDKLLKLHTLLDYINS